MTRERATISVQIFAPHATDRYAIANQKNIIPTSLTSHNGLYSMTV
jgi:hypothetical protein